MSAALVALLLTAVFIAPGMLYRYERNIRCAVPVSRRQRLLLAPATLAIGFAAVAAALWMFAAIRWILPEQTPNVGELLTSFGSYSRDNLPVLGAWATGVYGAALLLAFLSARFLPERQSDDDIDVSSWQYGSHHSWNREYGGQPHLVRVALESGEVVEGSLRSPNSLGELGRSAADTAKTPTGQSRSTSRQRPPSTPLRNPAA